MAYLTSTDGKPRARTLGSHCCLLFNHAKQQLRFPFGMMCEKEILRFFLHKESKEAEMKAKTKAMAFSLF